MGEGGKWVCGMSRYEKNRKPCVVYSFGLNNDSSFEQELLERTNCEIWGYDQNNEGFGPEITGQTEGRTHFMRAGVQGNTDPDGTPPAFFTIQDLMNLNGHDYMFVSSSRRTSKELWDI